MKTEERFYMRRAHLDALERKEVHKVRWMDEHRAIMPRLEAELTGGDIKVPKRANNNPKSKKSWVSSEESSISKPK